MNFPSLVKDPEKSVSSLIRKLTHSGELDLDKKLLNELKRICKENGDDLIIKVHKECMKHLYKNHSQVRVATVKLLDYLFQKSHIIRDKLLDKFDVFIELSLGISKRSDINVKLPPPKKFAALLQELAAKTINSWHSDFGGGYEKLRYAYVYLNENDLVDFSSFRVHNHEALITRERETERQQTIFTRAAQYRLKEFEEIKPEIEQLLAQIKSSIEVLIPISASPFEEVEEEPAENNLTMGDDNRRLQNDRNLLMQQHGIVNLSDNIEIKFSPFVEILQNPDNKDIIQNLRDLKNELTGSKMVKLVAIEKTLSKQSRLYLDVIQEIMDLKNRSTDLVLKLSYLKIMNDNEEETSNKGLTLNDADSSTDDDDFEEVEESEEAYISKALGLGNDPGGLVMVAGTSSKSVTNDDCDVRLDHKTADDATSVPVLTCNVKLESGKLCPRQDKVKCPFHGKMIPRDHKGIPINDEDRIREEKLAKRKPDVPDWQDPELLRELKEATGVDLTMPKKVKGRIVTKKNKLANTRTCDLTPKQRLKKRLKKLNK